MNLKFDQNSFMRESYYEHDEKFIAAGASGGFTQNPHNTKSHQEVTEFGIL